MLSTADAVRSHFRFEQDITHVQRLTLLEKRYNATDPAERADLAVALADNHTDQTDLRIAYAIAGGYDPDQLDRNGLTLAHNWIDISPSLTEQVRAYATPYQLAADEFAEWGTGPYRHTA
jgi:hypothetical protein